MTTITSNQTQPRKSTRKPARHAGRRTFGAVRQERSGRFAAHYTDPVTGQRSPASQTFDTERAADDWLTTVRADIVRGVHRPATFGAVPLADYFARWLASHSTLAQSTRDQYAEHLRRWIARDLTTRPTGPAGKNGRTLNLGSCHVNAMTPGLVREWFAAAAYTQQLEAAERAALAAHHADTRSPARIWAMANGIPVAERGRLSPVVIKAWKRDGSPTPRPAVPVTDPDARPATIIRQAYRTLHACLNDAVREGLTDANPCQIPGAGTSKAAERRTATVAQVDLIAAAMPDRYAAAVLVAAWSGLRAGELFGLSRAHVNLQAGTVRVDRAMLTRTGRAPSIGRTKTEASRRTVHLPAHALAVLTDHLDNFTAAEPDALVFCREDGTLVPARMRSSMFAAAQQTAGLSGLRWHDLRHTGATLAARTGASIREIQHRLGHSTYAAAMTYQHTSAEQDRDLAGRLDQLATAERDGSVTSLDSRRVGAAGQAVTA